MANSFSGTLFSRAGLVVALLICGSLDAAAAIVPLTQTRTLSSFGDVVVQGVQEAVQSDSEAAPGFGVFNDNVGLSINYTHPTFAISASINGIATQNSNIAAGLIAGTLLADANVDLADFEFFDSFASASTRSAFLVDFEVNIAQTFRLVSTAPVVFDSGDAFLQLRQGATVLAETFAFGPALDELVALVPGVTYTLEAQTSASPFAFGTDNRSGRGEIEFSLQPIPEPGSIVLFLSAGGLLIIRRRVKGR